MLGRLARPRDPSSPRPQAREHVARAFAEHVKVASGTDAGVYPHGLSAREFAVMVKLGMAPLAAIQSATINAADLLGWSDKVGALEPGHTRTSLPSKVIRSQMSGFSRTSSS
jgi:imidazolonepropionase-like amidohydrolase